MFYRRMTRRHRMERTVTKALPTFIRTYSLFRSGCLGTNIKLTLYKTLFRSVTTYSCSTWVYAADAYLLQLHHLQNRVLRDIGNLDMCKQVRKLHVVLKIPYEYKFITKLCRTQADAILKLVNPNVHGTVQEEAIHKKYKRLKLGGSQAYD
jgi:hypothetical protein